MNKMHLTLRWVLGWSAVACVSAFYLGRIVEHRHAVQFREEKNCTDAPRPQPPAQEQPFQQALADGPASLHEKAEKRLFEILQGPLTRSRESEMVRFFEDLGRLDGAYAVSLAEAEPNIRLRAELLRTAVKGWGEADLNAATRWALRQNLLDGAQAIASALQGGVKNPDVAISVAKALIADAPERSTEFGHALISALTESDHFERAATFALSGVGEQRDSWILSAFSRWSEYQPIVAAAFATSITDADARESALGALVVGWAPTDPSSLIEFAQTQLTGHRQSEAISKGLEFWAERDPRSAARWINEHTAGETADIGKATLAQSPAFSSTPELALKWASTIDNPSLRSETLTTVAERWAALQPNQAIAFVSSSPTVEEPTRSQLLSRLKTSAQN